jgi:hypothetical protein
MNNWRPTKELDAVAQTGLRVSLLKLGLFLLWVGFCILLLFINSVFGWWMLLVLALPLHALAGWIGARVFADKYGWSTEQVGFSLKRIAFGVFLVLGLGTGTYLVLRVFGLFLGH